MRVLLTQSSATLVALIALHATSNQKGVVALGDNFFPSAFIGLSDKSIEMVPRVTLPSVPMRSTILPTWKEISPRGVSIFLNDVSKYWARIQETDIQTFTGYYPNSALQQKEAQNKIEAYYDKAEQCLRRNDMRNRKNFFEFNQVMAFVRVCLMDVPMPTFQNRIEEPNKTFSPTTMPGQVQIATQQPMIRPTETPTDQPTVAVMPTEFPSAIPVQIPFDDMPTKTPYDPNAVMQTGAAPTIQSPPSFYTEAPLTNEPVINIPHIEIPSVDASEESTFAKHSQHPNYLVSHVEETVAFPSSKTFSIIEEPPNVPLVQDIFENSIPLFVAPEINTSVVNAPVVSEPPLDASGETIPLVEENYLHPIVTFSPFLKKKETAQFSQSVNPESYTFLPSSSQVAPFWAIDRDHSGLITKDEWTFYSQHLAKNALQIINQTKDPIAKKLLFSQVKYHYPRLNKCIHTKLINTRVNEIDAEEFISFRLWIQNYCFVKFRFSLLGGPPLYELVIPRGTSITNLHSEASSISNILLTEWFNSKIDQAEKELQKDEISFHSLPYRQINALHHCALEQFASAPEKIDKEKFYQIFQASQDCIEKKLLSNAS